MHVKPNIRSIKAIFIDGIVITDPQVRRSRIKIFNFLENQSNHPLNQRDNIILIDKSELHIDLRKFGLPVSTQIFITETFYNLKVAVETGDHQQLFKKLR